MEQELIWENKTAILTWFKGQRGWYCKKNQPANYIRITCRKDPANRDNPFFWICRLQVFVKNKFQDDIRISADAYASFPMSPGWSELKIEENGNFEYRIYKTEHTSTP